MTSVSYYDENANQFFAGTIGADMTETRHRFLAHIPAGGHVLDAGCGSGRDTACFLQAGYQVTAFDASNEMVKRATEHSGSAVLHMKFEDIVWDAEFDGVWACASLLHVSQAELSKVVDSLAKALRPHGVLYGSFKYGAGEVERDGRTFTNQTEESLAKLMEAVPALHPMEVWISEDVRPMRNECWLNFLCQKRML